MTVQVADAVVIGAGPNGLVAANALADAGWDVVVLEANDTVGGAVRSAEVTRPGFVTDLFSAFYPLAAASPVIRDLDLERHGLAWERSPAPLAHVLDDGFCAVIEDRAEDTAAGLEAEAAGDGDAWLELVRQWDAVRDAVLDALFTPFPPVRPLARLLRAAGTGGTLDLVRLALTPVRRLGTERFRGQGGPLLLTGNAMHSDLPPDASGSGVFGWLLAMLAQDVGFPVPRGGAGELTQSLARRAESLGAQVRTGSRVTRVTVRDGRARGVVLADGTSVIARRAVLADVSAPALYGDLLEPGHVPPSYRRALARFEWDASTIKVNWALSQRIPWTAAGARGAGTVHLGVDLDGFVDVSAALTTGRVPQRPFMLFGQMATADASRAPQGCETAWAYTHVPRSLPWDRALVDEHVGRVQDAVERVAPGFGATVLDRVVQGPADLEESDANLSFGAINGGTSGLHQQFVFRPAQGLGRAETPIPGLLLASASAHPGGGVHGACGWNAARAALADAGPTRLVHRALVRTAWDRVLPRD